MSIENDAKPDLSVFTLRKLITDLLEKEGYEIGDSDFEWIEIFPGAVDNAIVVVADKDKNKFDIIVRKSKMFEGKKYE